MLDLMQPAKRNLWNVQYVLDELKSGEQRVIRKMPTNVVFPGHISSKKLTNDAQMNQAKVCLGKDDWKTSNDFHENVSV